MDKELIDKIVRTKCIVCNKSELSISTICQKCSPDCWWCDSILYYSDAGFMEWD